MRKFIAILILTVTSLLANCQTSSKLIIHKTSCDSIEYALNSQGQKLIELQSNEKFIVEEFREESRSTLFDHVKIYSNERGPLVVLSSDCFFLMDTLGNRIKKLTKYGTIYSAWDRILKARLLKNSPKDTSYYVFLDELGREMFEGQHFLYSTNFNEEKAIVKNTDGSWQILSIDNNEDPIEIDSRINAEISSANSFYNGLALVKTKDEAVISGDKTSYSYYYINESGEIAFSVEEKIGKYNHFGPSNFDEQNAFVKVKNDVIFFNKIGEKIYTLEKVSNIMNRRGRFIQFYLQDNSRIIIDRLNLEKMNFFKNEDESITIDKIFDNFLKIYYSNNLTKKRGYRYVNLFTLETDFETNHKVVRVLDDKILVGSKNYPNDLYFIKNKADKILFKNNCK